MNFIINHFKALFLKAFKPVKYKWQWLLVWKLEYRLFSQLQTITWIKPKHPLLSIYLVHSSSKKRFLSWNYGMQNFCCRIFTSNFISQTPLCNMKVLPSRVTSCKLRGRFFCFSFSVPFATRGLSSLWRKPGTKIFIHGQHPIFFLKYLHVLCTELTDGNGFLRTSVGFAASKEANSLCKYVHWYLICHEWMWNPLELKDCLELETCGFPLCFGARPFLCDLYLQSNKSNRGENNAMLRVSGRFLLSQHISVLVLAGSNQFCSTILTLIICSLYIQHVCVRTKQEYEADKWVH